MHGLVEDYIGIRRLCLGYTDLSFEGEELCLVRENRTRIMWNLRLRLEPMTPFASTTR